MNLDVTLRIEGSARTLRPIRASRFTAGRRKR